MDLANIFGAFHPKTIEYTFLSSTHETSSRIDHIVVHKTNINEFNRIKIIPCVFSGHKTMKLGVNHKNKCGKATNTWRFNNMLLNNEWVNQQIKQEIKKVRRNK